MLELAGGEAQRVTNWVTGARAPRFSPDGRSVLFIGLAHPGAGNEADNRKAADERKARKYNVRAYDSFPIRHWDRWLDDLRPTLVVQPLDGTSPARDLLAGSALRRERGYGGRLGNEGETLDAAWTPDGGGVVFAATTNRHEAARAEVDLSLWLVSLAGGEPRRLTTTKAITRRRTSRPMARLCWRRYSPLRRNTCTRRVGSCAGPGLHLQIGAC